MYTPTLKMLKVEEVGAYAIQIQWSDGHGSGIYSFDHWRKICQCPECKLFYPCRLKNLFHACLGSGRLRS